MPITIERGSPLPIDTLLQVHIRSVLETSADLQKTV
jgi:hypothetical protein